MANFRAVHIVGKNVDKRQAAEYLGVSTRTLERLASEGRLTKLRQKGKTRPVIVFSETELEGLKEELAVEGRKRSTSLSKPLQHVGFRLDDLYVRRLTSEAQAHGMSPGEYARHLVIQSLEGTERSRVADELRSLREAMADTFHAFLTLKCGASEEEATSFVNETILRDS